MVVQTLVALVLAMPSYADQFPYPRSVTSYGEVNGTSFYSARGVIPESPSVAVERLKRAFGKEGTLAQSSPNGNHGVFWQLRGMTKLTDKEKNRVERALKAVGGKLVEKMSVRTGTQPLGSVYWVLELLCSLDVIVVPGVCREIAPLDLAIILDAAIPKPQWHAVSLERRADGTHFNWSIWPEVKLESLFGVGDLKSRKANCGRAKHPLPYDSDCMIIGRFINNASAGRIEISHTPMPPEAAEKAVGDQLAANGWGPDPVQDSIALPGFQFLRSNTSGATLLLKCDAHPDGGTQIFYIEMEAGI